MVISEIQTGGPYYATWAGLLGYLTFQSSEIAILGKEALTKSKQLQRNYLPTSIYSGGTEENLPLLKGKLLKNRTLIYVCRNKTCNLPVEDVNAALQELQA